MRVLAILLLVAGCPGGSLDAPTDGIFGADAGLDKNPAPSAPCVEDTDCALAGPTCCACPSFAVGANDPQLKSCSTIACPAMDCPTNLRAACITGSCQLACAPVACSTSCASGYAADGNGCLTCACLEPGPDSCTQDTDCVEAAADCCGCAHGGSDFAILASQAASYEASLACPPSPQCPNQNVCAPDLAPHCTQGTCALESPHPLPSNACGRPDLAPCPAGQTCVVNTNPDATSLGVGVCMPQ